MSFEQINERGQLRHLINLGDLAREHVYNTQESVS